VSTLESSKRMKARVKDRKLSIPILMPQSLLANIDSLKGRYPVAFLFAKYYAQTSNSKKRDKMCRPLRTALSKLSLYARTVAMAGMAVLWYGQVLEFNYQH
jgi:hypothetical protein